MRRYKFFSFQGMGLWHATACLPRGIHGVRNHHVWTGNIPPLPAVQPKSLAPVIKKKPVKKAVLAEKHYQKAIVQEGLPRTFILLHAANTVPSSALLSKIQNISQHLGCRSDFAAYCCGHSFPLAHIAISPLLTKVVICEEGDSGVRNAAVVIDAATYFLKKNIAVQVAVSQYWMLAEEEAFRSLSAQVLRSMPRYAVINFFAPAEEPVLTEDDLRVALQKEYLKMVLPDSKNESVDTLCVLGDMALRLNEHQQSLRYYQCALEHNPLSERPLFAMAKVYYAMKAYDDAWDCYKHYLSQCQREYQNTDHINIARVLDAMGQLLVHKKDYDTARQYYQDAVDMKKRLFPEGEELALAESLHGLGDSYFHQENYRQALRCYLKSFYQKRLVKTTQDNKKLDDTFEALGDANSQLKEYKHALHYYEKSIGIKKQSRSDDFAGMADILSKMGSVYFAQQNYDRALYYYKTSLLMLMRSHIPPLETVNAVRYKIGSVYDEQDCFPQALRYYVDIFETKSPSPLLSCLLQRADTLMTEEKKVIRQLVMDLETTGFSIKYDKVTEIACIEVIDGKKTGRYFHSFVNPEREVHPMAQKITGQSWDQLKEYPVFEEIAPELIAFMGDADLVVHSSQLDIGLLNKELSSLYDVWCPIEKSHKVIDTLVLAEKQYRGQKNSLNALCERCGVDNSGRDTHNAKLDAELLVEVYAALQNSSPPDKAEDPLFQTFQKPRI
jgi:DNA polymerase III subunit epsilon